MASDRSNFGRALKEYNTFCRANPVWFDQSRDVMADTNDGKMILMHAIAVQLKAAYEAGQAGKPPPPLRNVAPSGRATEAEAVSATPAPRIQRSRPAPSAPAVPAIKQRVVRRTR